MLKELKNDWYVIIKGVRDPAVANVYVKMNGYYFLVKCVLGVAGLRNVAQRVSLQNTSGGMLLGSMASQYPTSTSMTRPCQIFCSANTTIRIHRKWLKLLSIPSATIWQATVTFSHRILACLRMKLALRGWAMWTVRHNSYRPFFLSIASESMNKRIAINVKTHSLGTK